MRKQSRFVVVGIVAISLAAMVLLQGCGGSSNHSAVSGTVADIDRNTIIGAEVSVDGIRTESLASGIYRLRGVESGWRTIRAEANVGGELWVGSTAAEVLKNEPTMNINIVVAPARDTTEIGGTVRDDTGHRVAGARVLLTTRIVYPGEDTSAYDGPYGSIVAITDREGRYLLEDVPVGLSAIISASKVGFRNDEFEIDTTRDGLVINFDLVESDLAYSPDEPYLDAIEAYTMPSVLTRSADQDAYRAIRAFTSERYRKALASKEQVMTRATPPGSLIEVDLYFNAIDLNDSRDVAGYGIYRTTSPSLDMEAIDFIRDPYANFYSDTGAEITPYQNYYYAVSTVDVEFLDEWNRPDPAAESILSNTLATAPLGQLRVSSPSAGASVTGDPLFQWSSLRDVDWYTIYVYDEFPTLPLDPNYDYYGDAGAVGTYPIWPSKAYPEESTVGGGATSIRYDGPLLVPGHRYYWVVVAGADYESDEYGSFRSAYSYSEIRSFVAR